MKDGIEKNSYSLYASQIIKEKPKKQENPEKPEKQEKSVSIKDYLYIYIPKNGDWEDFIITDNSEKAMDMIKKNNGRIEIFKKDFTGLYKPTYI